MAELLSLVQMSIAVEAKNKSSFLEGDKIVRYKVIVDCPRENGWKPGQLVTPESAIALFYLFYDSSLKLSGESKAKEKLADLIAAKLNANEQHRLGTTFSNTKLNISDVDTAEKCGRKMVKRLRGDFNPETDIHPGELSGYAAILLQKIICDSVLKLPWKAREDFAIFLGQSLDNGNDFISCYVKRLTNVDYSQIERLGRKTAEVLRLKKTTDF